SELSLCGAVERFGIGGAEQGLWRERNKEPGFGIPAVFLKMVVGKGGLDGIVAEFQLAVFDPGREIGPRGEMPGGVEKAPIGLLIDRVSREHGRSLQKGQHLLASGIADMSGLRSIELFVLSACSGDKAHRFGVVDIL